MPLVHFRTNKFLSDGGGQAAALELSEVVAEILGKPEEFVQVVVEGGRAMAFGGTVEPTAQLDIASIGLTKSQAENCSYRLCKLIELRFLIPPDRIYIRMSDHDREFWGWKGKTFAK